jgi:hypothetical protein
MNLFRSEAHVKKWSLYDPMSEESIMPLSDWAQLLSHPLFTRRLDPDYLSRTPEYISAFFAELRRWGKTGPFWTRS